MCPPVPSPPTLLHPERLIDSAVSFFQMKTSAPAPQSVALPLATTPWAASSASVLLGLTLTRPLVGARMWMSAQLGAVPAAMGAQTLMGATYVAALEDTSELDKGELLCWVRGLVKCELPSALPQHP